MKEQYIEDLKLVANIVGHIPKREEYRTYGSYGSNGIQKIFGTYGNAIDIAFKDEINAKERKKEHKCSNCGAIVKRSSVNGDIFCSKSCSVSFNNRKRGVNNKYPDREVVTVLKHKHSKTEVQTHRKNRFCLECGKSLREKKNKKSIFCDNVCHNLYKNNKFIEEWKKDSKIANTLNGVSLTIRRYIFNKFDNKCSRCGWCEINQTTGKSPLELEHIDGDYRNNSEDNLTILCPNCHSLTPTYKALNHGNGRSYRRKRYKEGKSF